MRSRCVPRGPACLGLAVKLFRCLSPRRVPGIRIAILDPGNGGEGQPNVHNALRGVADHRTGNKVEAGIRKESAKANGIWRRYLWRWAVHRSSS